MIRLSPPKLLSFVGLVGFYRQFVVGFSILSMPLSRVTDVDVLFV